MNPDKRVFELMKQYGGDNSTSRPVHFYFYFPEEESAIEMGERLKNMNFEIEVSPAALGDKWLCFATRTMVPDSDIIEGLRAVFTNMCIKLDGEYDGWETELI
ncbi:MAG: ribonuclease E inhibitor RraB [Balneolaceae bacterium]|nr:ribonuclease E inhibitor RraB [Balneolaceae bacterium]